MSSYLADSETWDAISTGYAETTQMHLAELNRQALALIPLRSDMTVLDLACGPGTSCLPLAKSVGQIDALDFSEKMLTILSQRCKGIPNINPILGDGQNVPARDDRYDLIFSFFGLIFFPELSKGLKEIARLLKTDGIAIVSSWPPMTESSAMEILGSAFASIFPQSGSNKGPALPLQHEHDFIDEGLKSGLKLTQFRKISHEFEAKSARSYIDDCVKGGAPLQKMKNDMGADKWKTVEDRLVNHLNLNHSFPKKLQYVGNYAYFKKS